jgi:hypothetical protein
MVSNPPSSSFGGAALAAVPPIPSADTNRDNVSQIAQSGNDVSSASRSHAGIGQNRTVWHSMQRVFHGVANSRTVASFDIVAAFRQFNDNEFRQLFQDPELVSVTAPLVNADNIANLRGMLATLDNPGNLPNLTPQERQDLRKKIQNAIHALGTLRDNASVKSRAIAVTSMLTLLTPLPLALPFIGEKQYKFGAVVIASLVKTTAYLVALGRLQTADTFAFFDLFRNRYGQVFCEAVGMAIPTILPKARWLTKNVPFNTSVAIASFFVNMATLFPEAFVAAGHTMARLWQTPEQRSELTPDEQALLARWESDCQQLAGIIQSGRSDFKASGKAITDLLDRQTGYAIAALADAAKAAGSRGGVNATDQNNIARPNDDWASKFTLAFISVGLCVLTIVMTKDDPLAVLNLSVDAASSATVMFATALNSSKSKQEAINNFKAWNGLSLSMLFVLGIAALYDKIHHIEDTPHHQLSEFEWQAPVLTALNLTFPGLFASMDKEIAKEMLAPLNFLREEGGKLLDGARHLFSEAPQSVRTNLDEAETDGDRFEIVDDTHNVINPQEEAGSIALELLARQD